MFAIRSNLWITMVLGSILAAHEVYATDDQTFAQPNLQPDKIVAIVADSAVVAPTHINQDRVRKAHAEFACMARNSNILCWTGFIVQTALGVADTYAFLAPVISGRCINCPHLDTMGWGAWSRRFLTSLSIMAVKSLVVSIINEKAEPILARFREKNYIPISRCWFLRSTGLGQYVALSHDMVRFIELLQTFDVGIRNVALNGNLANEQSCARCQVALQAVVMNAERILGHIRYAECSMAKNQEVASAITRGVAERFEKLTEDFCITIEKLYVTRDSGVVYDAVNTACDKFMHEYQSELFLLRSVPIYALELW